jgi:putative N-acetylmannosamine-6-phosphate epimerase
MVSAFRISVATIAALLCACAGGPLETQYGKTGVRAEEWTEIRAAIRKVTTSPVIGCSRPVDSPGRGPVTVWTQDKKSYRASKINGKWHFDEVFVII